MHFRRVGGAAAALFLSLGITAAGATDIWDGGGPDDNLTTPANWVDDSAPVSNLANTELIFAGVVRLMPFLGEPFSARSVTFNNSAGAFTFSGATLSVGTGGIVNGDTQTMTFANVVSFAEVASSAINAASGGLSFTNDVLLPAGTLTVTGASATSFRGIAGAGGLSKLGSGTMTWAPQQTTQFDLTINEGTLALAADGTTDLFGASSEIAVNSAATLNINDNMVLDGAKLTRTRLATISLAAGKTLTVRNGGDAIISEGFTFDTPTTLAITGAGSSFVSGGVTFRDGATLKVEDGGAISTGGISFMHGSSGTVDGAGSSVNSEGNGTGGTGVGVSNNQTPGSGSLVFSNGSTGALGFIRVGDSHATGSLLIQSGASVTASDLTLGGAPLLTANVTITGAGSLLTLKRPYGYAYLGQAGRGFKNHAMRIENGGTFTASSGVHVSETATLAIAGGGTYNANGGVYIGGGQLIRDADGILNLAPDRTLSVGQAGSAAISGAFSLPTGSSIRVSNDNAQLSVTGALTIASGSSAIALGGGGISAGSVNIGTAGTGTLTIDGYGSSLTASETHIGANGSAGTLTFNGGIGTLGLISISGSDVAGSNGTLEIKSASVTAAGLNVGTSAVASTGVVELTAATLTLTGSATVGAASGSTASINVRSGELVTGNGTMTVHATGVIDMADRTTLAGTSDFRGTGPVRIAGNFEPGGPQWSEQITSVSFAQDMTFQPTTHITLQLNGTTPGTEHDQIVFEGSGAPHVMWNGTLNIVLLNDEGSEPQPGDRFDLFNFDPARASGAFSTVNLPQLPAGSVWNTEQLYIDGTIEVLAPADTYQAWQQAYGSGGFNNDDDGDGVANGLEWALGTNPKAPLGAGESVMEVLPPITSANERIARISFRLPVDPPNAATYRVRASSDLVNWTTIASKDGDGPWNGTANVTTEPGATGRYTRVTVAESLPLTSTLRFHRIDSEAP